MSFTDNDLTWLKKCGFRPGWEDGIDMDALLARLEAAEAFINGNDWEIINERGFDLFKSWRKAAGK